MNINSLRHSMVFEGELYLMYNIIAKASQSIFVKNTLKNISPVIPFNIDYYNFI